MTSLVNLKRYALVYVATVIGITVGIEVLWRLAGLDLNSTGTTVLPAMAADMHEGRKPAEINTNAYSNSEAWNAAIWMTLVALAIGVAILAALTVVPAFADTFQGLPASVWMVVLVVLGIVYLLCNRFFLTLGYKGHRKAIDKKLEDDFS